MKNLNSSETLVVGSGVRTPAGPGLCWQVFAGRVGVVPADDPRHVAYYHPREVRADPTAGLPDLPRKGRRGGKDHGDQMSFFGSTG